MSDPVRARRSGSLVTEEGWGRTYRESVGWFGIAASWYIGFALIVAMLAVGFMWFVRPSLLDAERVGNQQSQQYEATQIAGMRTDFDTVQAMDREIAQYQAQPASPDRDRLIQTDQAQRTNALNDIVRKRDLMPDKSKVPDDIAAYLARNGR